MTLLLVSVCLPFGGGGVSLKPCGSKGYKEECAVADDRMRELEERYEGYTVYDNAGEKIGKVDDLFVDETDREEYIGVRMGLFGLSGTTLIPMEITRINEQERAIEVSESKEHVKDGPTYSDDDEVTGDFEDRIRSHYGLESIASSGERGSYGRHAGGAASGVAASATSDRDDALRDERETDSARHAERPAGGAQDKDVHDERERDSVGREEYRNREDMGSESSMDTAGARDAGSSGGISDLETGEQGRGGAGYDEGYREGLREGLKEGLREATGGRGEPGRAESGERGDLETGGRDRMGDEGYRESGGRDEPGDREGLEPFGRGTARGDIGEEGMTRGGDREDVETRGGEREGQEMSADRSQDRSREDEESREGEGGFTRVWRRIRD